MIDSILPDDFQLQSPMGITLSVGSLIALWSIYTVTYNLWFHPLSHIPGPFWARATPIPYILGVKEGNLAPWINKLHRTYGEVVRITPTDCSFTSGETAWQDIYGFHAGKNKMGSFLKSKAWYPVPYSGSYSMLGADDADHSRMRKNWSHAFSDRSLREQEPLVQNLVDELIARLQEQADAKTPTDIMIWYVCTTFDVITDLTFGEPLYSLRDGRPHHWINMVMTGISAMGLIAVRNTYPIVAYVDYLMGFFKDNSASIRARMRFGKSLTEAINKRMESESTRPDFFTAMIKNQEAGKNALTKSEIHSNSGLFMTAGSETTSTLLAGATYLILQNPQIYKRLVTEIRSHFASADQITFEEVNKLEYLIAVLQEALRYYPPVPTGFPRTVPQGGSEISGHYIPGGTSVCVSQHATNHSERNFAEPDSFVPERWLKDTPAKFKDDKRAVMNPFSFGPRNCLGKNLAYAEMRTILAKVLWHFDLELQPGSERWIERNRLFVLWEKPALMVMVKPAQR